MFLKNAVQAFVIHFWYVGGGLINHVSDTWKQSHKTLLYFMSYHSYCIVPFFFCIFQPLCDALQNKTTSIHTLGKYVFYLSYVALLLSDISLHCYNKHHRTEQRGIPGNPRILPVPSRAIPILAYYEILH